MTRWLIAGALLCALVVPAHALSCAPSKQVKAVLTGKHKETVRGLGIVGSDRFAELYVSESGSWTLLLNRPDGRSCVLGAGKSWEFLPPPPPGDPT